MGAIPGELAGEQPDEGGDESPEGGVISGVVTDTEGGPLVGVRVEAVASTGGAPGLDLLPVLTDGDGRFAVTGLGNGRYDLRFSLGTVGARVLAVPVDTDQLTVRLARPQGVLVVVRTPADAAPAGLCHVVLERQTQAGWARDHVARTLKNRLLLWSIRPGWYRATAWASPFLPVTSDAVEVREGEPAPVVELALLARGAVIEGVVRGDPPAVAPVRVAWRRLGATWPIPPSALTVEAHADGSFCLRGLAAGPHRVTALDGEGRLGSVQVQLAEGGSAAVEIPVS